MNTAINPAAGGPVGGGMMMMNNGSPAMPMGMGMATGDASRFNLNTYIYDYLLKHGHYEVARAIIADQSFDFKEKSKTSPRSRKDGNEINGDNGDGMDVDHKDDVPNDLPRPSGWEGSNTNGFLLEWFATFMDIFQASKAVKPVQNAAHAYISYEKNNQRMREQMQNQNLGRQGMNPAMVQQRMNGMNGNMAQKMTPQQQMAMMKQRNQAMQQQMNRGEQPEGEVNGVRPGTPADGDAGGSPSKRPRIDNGQQSFNNGMMQNGRPGGAPGGQNQGMLMQAGFNPAMNPQFRQNGGMPPKGMQGNMPNGMVNMGNAGSPMMQMNQFPDGMQMEYNMRQNMQAGQPGMQAGGGGGAQSGNHALQDYQMQLMLLEQQNKKRLMMARQEQHENTGAGGPMPGVNLPPGAMSPGGSRTGTSPNPGEMKRTPGMGMPGSPSAAEAMAGRSPTAMNFMGNMQGGEFNPQMFMAGDKGQMMGPGPQGMRPPTSDMNPMRQQAGRPGQFQGGQPMQQQGSQAGQQIGTPGQREMPPPQAPAAGNNAQRTQGTSPAGANAPPTPQQSNKANPKGNKKGAANKDDNKRSRPPKKGAAAAAAADDNPPPTPNPSTPITPNNPGAMNASKAQPGMQAGNQQQNQAMQMAQPMQQNEMNFTFADPVSDPNSQNFNLDFSTLENADVLENFDFDSFLNTSADDTFNVDFGGDMSEFSINPSD